MSRHSSTFRTFLSIAVRRNYEDDMGLYESASLEIGTLFGDLSLTKPYKLSWTGIRYSITWQGFYQHREVDREHIEADIAQAAGKRVYTVWKKDDDGWTNILLTTPRKREALRLIEDRTDLHLYVQKTPQERWVADETED